MFMANSGQSRSFADCAVLVTRELNSLGRSCRQRVHRLPALTTICLTQLTAAYQLLMLGLFGSIRMTARGMGTFATCAGNYFRGRVPASGRAVATGNWPLAFHVDSAVTPRTSRGAGPQKLTAEYPRDEIRIEGRRDAVWA
jgi:hypothetical protein